MNSLFPLTVEPADIPPISGLSYRPGYISAAEERELVAAIDHEPWDTTWERRRQPYGEAYGDKPGPTAPIPSWAKWLVDRLSQDNITARPFDQMLVNEYLPGQGIALHRDYQPFDRTVVSLSLLSPSVMDFFDPNEHRRASLILEPRSLLILSDYARYHWQHGIARRKTDRWQGRVIRRQRRLSVTFRLRKRIAK